VNLFCEGHQHAILLSMVWNNATIVAGRLVLLLVVVVHIAGFSVASPSFWKARAHSGCRSTRTALFVQSKRTQQGQRATANRQIDQITSNRRSQWRCRQRHVQNIQHLRFPLRLSAKEAIGSSTSSEPSDGSTDELQHKSLKVAGVAVSCTGFWVILQLSTSSPLQTPHLPTTDELQSSMTTSLFLPIQITNGTMDATTATSPQALTVLQLLAGVDMAGAILPPTLLSEIVVRTCESDDDVADSSDTGIRRKIAEDVLVSVRTAFHANNITALPQQTQNYGYSHQNPWIRSRVRLPTCKLHQVLVRLTHDKAATNNIAEERQKHQFILDCTVQGYGRLSVPILEHSVLHRMFSSLCDENSDWPAFTSTYTALSLALRYCAPLSLVQTAVVDEQSSFLSENELLQQFPNYRRVADALQPADRSASNIAKSFEIHSLQAALTLARRRGDDMAAAKIRAAIDKLDEKSFQDIPVQADSDTSSME
jgi:hypothetical protein